MVLFEYPLNERIRTLLRFESLFEHLFRFEKEVDPLMQEVTFRILFEMVDACTRTDIRSELLKELDKHKKIIEQSCLNVGDELAVAEATQQLNALNEMTALLTASHRFGNCLTTNKWLTYLKNRFASFGFATDTEVPQYRLWQTMSVTQRQQQVHEWIEPIRPYYEAIKMALGRLRQSGTVLEASVGKAGSHAESLGGNICQLVRIWVDDQTLYPEVTANRHMISISFKRLNEELDSLPVHGQDISFKFSLCNL